MLIKYTGKYINIYFIMKITYTIIYTYRWMFYNAITVYGRKNTLNLFQYTVAFSTLVEGSEAVEGPGLDLSN